MQVENSQSSLRLYQHSLNISTASFVYHSQSKAKTFGLISQSQSSFAFRIIYPDHSVLQGCTLPGNDPKSEQWCCSEAYHYLPTYCYIIYQPEQCRINKTTFMPEGFGAIYNKRGVKLYQGQLRQGLRDGKGIQYDQDGNGRLYVCAEGTWKADRRQGHFSECNGNKKFECEYLDGMKHGLYTCDEDGIILYYQKNEIKAQQIEEQTKDTAVSGEEGVTYNHCHLTYEKLMTLRKLNVLDTGIIDMWAAIQQHAIDSQGKESKTVVLYTDIIRYFVAHNTLNYQNENVSCLTMKYRNEFCILGGYYTRIILPMRQGYHFVLGEIRIHDESKMEYCYYDSMNNKQGARTTWEIVRQYLLCDLKANYYPQLQSSSLSGSQKVRIKEKKRIIADTLRNLEPRHQKVCGQTDSFSCGVYVSAFIQGLVHNKQDERTGNIAPLAYRKRMLQEFQKLRKQGESRDQNCQQKLIVDFEKPRLHEPEFPKKKIGIRIVSSNISEKKVQVEQKKQEEVSSPNNGGQEQKKLHASNSNSQKQQEEAQHDSSINSNKN